MADLYGTDVRGLEDIDDPEVLVSEEENLAYALARRILQPDDALEEIGDLEEFDCFDIREYLGESLAESDLRALEARVVSVLSGDPRVESVDADVTFTNGALRVEATGKGTDGPFSFVATIDKLDISLIVVT